PTALMSGRQVTQLICADERRPFVVPVSGNSAESKSSARQTAGVTATAPATEGSVRATSVPPDGRPSVPPRRAGPPFGAPRAVVPLPRYCPNQCLAACFCVAFRRDRVRQLHAKAREERGRLPPFFRDL